MASKSGRFIANSGLRFNPRPGTMDSLIIEEVGNPSYYLDRLGVTRSDVVIDIGANIGVFTCTAALFARRVISYEPEPENYIALSQHVALNHLKNVELHRAAVVGNSDDRRQLYIQAGKNKGNHSLVPVAGRQPLTVSCVNINNIIEEHDPTKLKIDCEGSEMEIIRNLTDWRKVEAVALEFHANLFKDDAEAFYTEIIDRLNEVFRHVMYRPALTWGYQMVYARTRL